MATRFKVRDKIAIAAALGLLISVVGVPGGGLSTIPDAAALGFQSRNCSAWGLGSGQVHGFSTQVSGDDYGWTEIVDPCQFGIWVALRYQAYVGGPFDWSSRTYGNYFAIRTSAGVVISGEHCKGGVFCFYT